MDLPPLKNKGHEPRGNDFGERSQEQPMKMGSNKALQVTAHKAPNLNADVGLRKYWVAAREMDLPLPSTETASTARPRFGTGSGQNSQ